MSKGEAGSVTQQSGSGRARVLRQTVAVASAAVLLSTVGFAEHPVDAAGWPGFDVVEAPSVVGGGDSPSWGAGITSTLGGPGADIWNNNHGLLSEAIIDVATPGQSSSTAVTAGDPTMIGPDSHGVLFTDFDGDGDEDLIEVNGRNNANRLFRNDGGALTFVPAGGLADFDGRGRQPLAVDFDGDGDMDVLVTNLDRTLIDGFSAPSELYENRNGLGSQWAKVPDPAGALSNGNLRSAQLTSTGPATEPIIITHASFSVAIDSIRTGTSTLQGAQAPATRRHNTSHVREVIVADFDGDLHPEMLVMRAQEEASNGSYPMQVFDLVDGVSPRSATLPTGPLVDNCRSAVAADFDNDGDIDILAGCAQREEGQDRNIVLINNGTGNFAIAGTSILPATIAETPGAIVTGDLNNDGWMDAFVANGYDFDRAVDHIYWNRGGTAAHWLSINLIGSNPDAAGAQVFVGADSWQVRETGHRGHRNQDQRNLHFGLGSATSLAPVEIRWPDGTYAKCSISGIDRTVTIVQGSRSCAPSSKAALLATLNAAPDTIPFGPAPTPKFCQGQLVTVDIGAGETPTTGRDVILGTSGNDVINAGAGDDIVCGLEGNDRIDGGGGNDRITGDAGDDYLFGGNGRDVLQGGSGNDELDGGRMIDRLSGNAGSDILRGGDGKDQLRGHAGADRLYGGGGRDLMIGGPGVDWGNGGASVDSCTIETMRRC